MSRAVDALNHLLRRIHQYNPVHRAQANAAHHYDLSGTLYGLFLDADRQYSCAYFTHEHDDLEQAQQDKKRHLAAKLLLEPGVRVLDIGSGWGGLGALSGRGGRRRGRRHHAVAGAAQGQPGACRARRSGRSRALRAVRLPRGRCEIRQVRPDRVGRHVRARRRPALSRVLRCGERSVDRRRRRASAFDRPLRRAEHDQSLDPQVHLPGRLRARAVRGAAGGRAARACG